MPTVKKPTPKKLQGNAILSDNVRSHASDPFFIKQAAEAKEALSKIDLSILKEK